VEAPDVLMAMNVYKEQKGKDSMRVVVTGYPAWYHNFRTVPESGDSAWLILTNTSGTSAHSGEGWKLPGQGSRWWVGVPSKREGKSKRGHYVAASRRLGGSIGINEWAAIEAGWLKSNGLFYGFELGAGKDGDNMSLNMGFNIGGTYDFPSDVAQLVYGVSVGEWADMYYNSYRDENNFNFGVAGPFVKARWNFIEFAYRGLAGYDGVEADGLTWFNQYMVGLYFEF